MELCNYFAMSSLYTAFSIERKKNTKWFYISEHKD